MRAAAVLCAAEAPMRFADLYDIFSRSACAMRQMMPQRYFAAAAACPRGREATLIFSLRYAFLPPPSADELLMMMMARPPQAAPMQAALSRRRGRSRDMRRAAFYAERVYARFHERSRERLRSALRQRQAARYAAEVRSFRRAAPSRPFSRACAEAAAFRRDCLLIAPISRGRHRLRFRRAAFGRSRDFCAAAPPADAGRAGSYGRCHDSVMTVAELAARPGLRAFAPRLPRQSAPPRLHLRRFAAQLVTARRAGVCAECAADVSPRSAADFAFCAPMLCRAAPISRRDDAFAPSPRVRACMFSHGQPPRCAAQLRRLRRCLLPPIYVMSEKEARHKDVSDDIFSLRASGMISFAALPITAQRSLRFAMRHAPIFRRGAAFTPQLTRQFRRCAEAAAASQTLRPAFATRYAAAVALQPDAEAAAAVFDLAMRCAGRQRDDAATLYE